MAKISNLMLRNGKYYLRMHFNGKDKWKSFGSDKQAAILAATEYNRRKATAKLTNDNEELERLFAVKEKLTFEEAAKQYLDARSDLKAASLRNYRNYLTNYLLPVFGSVEIRSITETDVEYLLKSLKEQDFSAKHCNDIIRFARAICNVQFKRERIRRNPFTLVRLLRESGGGSKEKAIDPLSVKEIELAIDSMPEQWKLLFLVLSQTGMRPSELFALRWRDIDWRRNYLQISKARVKGKEDSPKTASSIREVYIRDEIKQLLRVLKRDRKVSSVDDYIFVRADGKPFDRYVDHVWSIALRNAGIRHRPCYQLRHSYISNGLMSGLEPGWIANQVGHSNLKMIYEKYGKYIPSEKSRNAEKLEKLFERKRTSDSAVS